MTSHHLTKPATTTTTHGNDKEIEYTIRGQYLHNQTAVSSALLPIRREYERASKPGERVEALASNSSSSWRWKGGGVVNHELPGNHFARAPHRVHKKFPERCCGNGALTCGTSSPHTAWTRAHLPRERRKGVRIHDSVFVATRPPGIARRAINSQYSRFKRERIETKPSRNPEPEVDYSDRIVVWLEWREGLGDFASLVKKIIIMMRGMHYSLPSGYVSKRVTIMYVRASSNDNDVLRAVDLSSSALPLMTPNGLGAMFLG